MREKKKGKETHLQEREQTSWVLILSGNERINRRFFDRVAAGGKFGPPDLKTKLQFELHARTDFNLAHEAKRPTGIKGIFHE